MNAGKAEDRALLWGVACFVLGVSATVLALLGTGWWPVATVLALAALFPLFHYEKICQRREPHGWNRHKSWSLLSVPCLVIGLVGVVVSLAFWVIRDSAGFDLFTLEGTGVTPAAYANLALFALGMLIVFRVDDSKLDL